MKQPRIFKLNKWQYLYGKFYGCDFWLSSKRRHLDPKYVFTQNLKEPSLNHLFKMVETEFLLVYEFC